MGLEMEREFYRGVLTLKFQKDFSSLPTLGYLSSSLE